MDWFRRADMVEIQMGQGAIAGIAHSTKYKDLSQRARRFFGLVEGQDAWIESGHPGIATKADFAELIDRLKRISGGVPVGVKLGAGNQLEADMELAVEMGADFIVVDGAEAATVGSEPLIQDAFGLPTLIALCRAATFLRKQGLTRKVSLIISGGLYHPEHFLKALTLGADAIYIGTVCLFAISHKHVFDVLPWEPPLDLILDAGKHKDRLNVRESAICLAKFLTSCTEEMVSGVREHNYLDLLEVVNRSERMRDAGTYENAGQVRLGHEQLHSVRVDFGPTVVQALSFVTGITA